MNNDIEKWIHKAVETYVDILEDYERTFRKQISNQMVGYGITEQDLIALPREMHNLVKDYWDDKYMLSCFYNLSDNYANKYYEKTIESFQEHGIDLTIDGENGVIFETLLLHALHNIEGVISNNKDIPNLNRLTSTDTSHPNLEFKGVGYKGGHGDYAIMFKGVQMPAYIDAKYSQDRSIVISKTKETFNSPDDIEYDIIDEVQRGIEESIAYNKNKGGDWYANYIHAISSRDYSEELGREYYKAGYKIPKILIYIFKDKGLWASETLEELEERLINNALKITRDRGIQDNGEYYTKAMLWYMKDK